MRTFPPRLRHRRRLAVAATALVVGIASAPPPSMASASDRARAGSEVPPVGAVPSVSSRTYALTSGAGGNRVGTAQRLAVPAGTQSVGLSWAGALPGEVEVRGRTAEGWTDWQHLHGESAEGPDRSGRTGTALAWLASDGIDAVEVVVTSALPDLELQAIRADVPRSAPAPAATTSATPADGRPSILPRSSWTTKGWVPTNPDCTPAPESAVSGIDYAVVHHTDSANSYSSADVPALIASIYAFHTGTNRWCDIAYNFLVDRYGRIFEGRSGGVDQPIVGGHARGFNRGSVGVALLGSHQSSAPTAASLTAVGRVVGWKLALHRHDPTARTTVIAGDSPKYAEGTAVTIDRVVGHRDVGLTACPGTLVHAQLDAVASTAAAFQGTLPAPPAALAPFRLAHDLVVQQYRDVLRRDPTAERISHWAGRLAAGTTPGELASYLITSQEADDLLHAITRLYRAYFGRNPDHAGFEYWANRRAAGTTLARISNTFAASSEFRSKYGALTDAQFVDLVYRNVLGRAADPSGTAYWVRRLAAGTDRGVVMLQFSQSSEHVRTTRSGTWVVAAYEALLRRAVTEGAYESLVAELDAGDRDVAGVATTLLVSDSYRRRIAPLT